MIYVCNYSTPLGNMTAASDGTALTGLWFDGQKYFGSTMEKEYEEKQLPVFEQTKQWLDLYFQKKIPDFMPPVSLNGSDFRMTVWGMLSEIPYGHTTTYGAIAKKIAAQKGIACMSAQAVGKAVGNNPVSILIPCHRVVGTGGKLTGYAGGIEKKEALLALEQEVLQSL